MKKRNLLFVNTIILLTTLIIVFLTYNNFFITGVYKWHITQPEFVQGGIELLGFIFLMYILGIFSKNNKVFVLLLLGAVYLSLNGVILPVILSYLYIESTNFIGHSILSYFKKNNCFGLEVSFLTGLSVWTLFALLFSLLGQGSINDLRILTVLMVLFCFILKRKNFSYKPIVFKFKEYCDHSDNSLYLLIVLIFSLSLALFAKTNSAIDYDSIWYGLRSEYVLIGNNSIFDNLGYTSFVYYYPKLTELYLIPLNGLHDYSFIISANIYIFLIAAVTVYKKFINIVGEKWKNLGLLTTLLIFSVPAISNISATAKADILSTFLMTILLFYGVNYLLSNKKDDLYISLTAGFLSYASKPTSFLYSSLIIVGLLIITVINFIHNRKKPVIQLPKDPANFRLILLVSGTIDLLLLTYRTYILTGYPTYPVFIEIWNKLGFVAKYPFKNTFNMLLNSENIFSISFILKRLYNMFFDPNNLSKVIMLWTGNFLIVLVLFLLLKRVKIFKVENNKELSLLTLLSLPVFLSGVYYSIAIVDPDGNYFMIPIILAGLITTAYIVKNIDAKDSRFINSERRFISTVMSLFLMLNLFIMFVSHSSWSYGTKVFTNELLKTNFETEKINETLFLNDGVGEIAAYVKNHFSQQRILYFGGSEQLLFRIEGRLEPFSHLISNHNSGGDIGSNYENFKRYIEFAKIKGFIINKNYSTLPYKNYLNQLFNEKKVTSKIEDKNYILYCIE